MDWVALASDWRVLAAAAVLCWLFWPRRRRDKSDGAERAGEQGELRVVRELRARGCQVIHNALVPYRSGRGHAQIDALALTGGGIVVLEVKRWAGTIYADPTAEKWVVVSKSGVRDPGRHSPLAQNALHVQALREQFPSARFKSAVVVLGGALVGSAPGVYTSAPSWIVPGSPDAATRAAWQALTALDGKQDKKALSRAHKARVSRRAA